MVLVGPGGLALFPTMKLRIKIVKNTCTRIFIELVHRWIPRRKSFHRKVWGKYIMGL
jgi:hypothetical protein